MKPTTLALATLITLAASSTHAATFRFTFENLGPQGLSPAFWSVGNRDFDLFQLGTTASAGIEGIAESGSTTAMEAIAAGAGASVSAYGRLAGSLMPGQSRSIDFDTDETHGYFSFASMLGRTNDGFIGESFSSASLDLFANGQPRSIEFVVTGLRAWDAGTEANTQNMADLGFLGGTASPVDWDTSVRIHDSISMSTGDSWTQMPDWSLDTPLARVKVEVVPEPGTMLALVAGLVGLIRRRR